MQSARLASTIFFGVCISTATILLSSSPSQAFCIYNETDTEISVKQGKGAKFESGYKSRIGPREKGCVNWKESSVNESERRDGELSFYMSAIMPAKSSSDRRGETEASPGKTEEYRIKCIDKEWTDAIKIKAGGWIALSNLSPVIEEQSVRGNIFIGQEATQRNVVVGVNVTCEIGFDE